MQQFLKPSVRAAWARVIPTELLTQLLVRMNGLLSTLDVRFGRVALASLATGLEGGESCRGRIAWFTSAGLWSG